MQLILDCFYLGGGALNITLYLAAEIPNYWTSQSKLFNQKEISYLPNYVLGNIYSR